MNKTRWENEYKSTENLWGTRPQECLVKYADIIPRNGKVLDIGIGEGRNALTLVFKSKEWTYQKQR